MTGGKDNAGSAHVTSELQPTSDTERLTAPGLPDPLGARFGDGKAWLTAASTAGLAWLATLCVGAVCLLAPKLQFPGFARGSDPVEMFTGVVVMSLALFGVPVHIGGLTISALPLGALVVVGMTIAWLVAGSTDRSARPLKGAVATGARVASVFALVAVLLSLVFRLRGGETVAADAPLSLLLTFWWCGLFAAAGALRHPRVWRAAIGERFATLPRDRAGPSGIGGGVVMVVVACLLAVAALILWIIVTFASGPVADVGWGEVFAALVYLIAFLPNVVTAIVALAVGAPILQGAQVGVGGRLIGDLREFSLLDRANAPVLIYGLLIIPVLAGTAGGWFVARWNATRTLAWRPVLIAAFVFAVTFALLAWVGEARVGAGLVRDKGFARVAVLPIPTFAWAMLWGSVFGWFGWELAMRKSSS